MKINWGTKLAFFAILFMGFVVFMVIRISQTDIPLVEENYYEKGIGYQQEIDRKKGADKLINVFVGRISMVGFDSSSKWVFLQKYTLGDTIYGNAFFYRASDAKMDFNKDFRLIDSIPALFDVTNLSKGKWKIILNWERNHIKHLFEKEIEL
ncbi:MAG: FixH family protein [Bacteroidota bacterium]|nr:FixH family protein [Bacteroidota bacterium]